MRSGSKLVSRALMIAGASAALAGSGCSLFEMRPGGNMRSEDQFTYVSTPYQPLTVTLIDTRDEQEFWSVDVPIGKKLTLRFYEDKGEGSDYAPDVMRWQIYEQTSYATKLRNQIPVPSALARRIDVTLREGPEYPESIQAARQAPRDPGVNVPAYVPEGAPTGRDDADIVPVSQDDGTDMVDVGVATGTPTTDD